MSGADYSKKCDHQLAELANEMRENDYDYGMGLEVSTLATEALRCRKLLRELVAAVQGGYSDGSNMADLRDLADRIAPQIGPV